MNGNRARGVAVREPIDGTPDYADAFELRLSRPDGRPVEQWMRADGQVTGSGR
jgi:hypothetical protein